MIAQQRPAALWRGFTSNFFSLVRLRGVDALGREGGLEVELPLCWVWPRFEVLLCGMRFVAGCLIGRYSLSVLLAGAAGVWFGWLCCAAVC